MVKRILIVMFLLISFPAITFAEFEDLDSLPKRFTITAFMLKPDSTLNQFLTGNEYDEPATGDYEGWNIIRNHKKDGICNIYFIVTANNGIMEKKVKIERLNPPPLNEVLTRTGTDGVTRTATRGNWNEMFSQLDVLAQDGYASPPSNLAPDLYAEYDQWLFDRSEAAKIAQAYMQNVYVQMNFSQADIKAPPRLSDIKIESAPQENAKKDKDDENDDKKASKKAQVKNTIFGLLYGLIHK